MSANDDKNGTKATESPQDEASGELDLGRESWRELAVKPRSFGVNSDSAEKPPADASNAKSSGVGGSRAGAGGDEGTAGLNDGAGTGGPPVTPPLGGGGPGGGGPGGPSRGSRSNNDSYNAPDWLMALLGLLFVGGTITLLQLGIIGPPPPPPPPPPLPPGAIGSCDTPSSLDEWMTMPPSPPQVSCDRYTQTSSERNKYNFAQMLTYSGSTLALDGSHRVYVFFVALGSRRYTAAQREYLLERTKIALGGLGRIARTVGDNCLHAELVPIQADLLSGVLPSNGLTSFRLPITLLERKAVEMAAAEDPSLDLKRHDFVSLWTEARREYGVPSASFLFFVPVNGRSYAQLAAFDRTVLFADPASLVAGTRGRLEKTIAHEFLHLAGADDLYNVRPARNYHLDSIMNLSCPTLQNLSIDPFSAFSVGLGDGYDPSNDPPVTPFRVRDRRGPAQTLH